MDLSTTFRKFRQAVASLSIATMLATFGFANIAYAEDFTDVSSDAWYYSYVMDLVDASVVDGASESNDWMYRPGDYVNRAEMVKLAVVAASLDLDSSAGPTFDDVSEDAWYYDYVETGYANGVVSGYEDGTYGPGDNVTRAQAVKMLVNAFGFDLDSSAGPTFSDVASDAWYYDYVETAYAWSVLDGYSDGTFWPDNYINRAEVAKVLSGAMNPTWREGDDDTSDDDTSDDDTSDDDTTDDTSDDDAVVQSAAGLTVAMGDEVSGGSVPKGATAVSMVNVSFTAGEEDAVIVDSIVATRKGVGSSSDFTNVYLYNGSERLTSGRSVSTDTNTVEFNNLNVEVGAGVTVTLTITADFSTAATTGDENYFEVDEDGVTSNAAEMSGDFPISGDAFTVAGASAGTLTVTKNGTVADPTIGSQDATIAEFKLAAANEDQDVTQVALILKGTVSSSDVSNFKLWQGSDLLATDDLVNNDEIFTFVLDTAYNLSKGDSRVFTVTADISGSATSGETVQVYVDETTDVVSIGEVYGYGVTVDIGDSSGSGTYNGSGTNMSSSTLQGGDFTIAFNGPSASNIAVNAKDVVLLRFSVTAVSDVEVKQLAFTVADQNTSTGDGLISGTTAANYTDLKLIDEDSGSTLMGPKELSLSGSDATQDLTYTDAFDVDAGETLNLAFTADIRNNTALTSTTADQLAVTLKQISSAGQIRDLGSGNDLVAADIVPDAAVTGYTMTMTQASLTLALASTPVTGNSYVKGTEGVEGLGVLFTAGTASDVTVTGITVGTLFKAATASTYSSSSSDAGTDVVTVYLYDGDGVLLGTGGKSLSSGSVTFTGLDWDIGAGQTEQLVIVGNIGTASVPVNSGGDQFAYTVAASSVTAQDEDANSLTPSGGTVNSTPTVAFTVTSAGTLTVAAPDTQVTDGNLTAGSSSATTVAKFKLRSTAEAFTVERMTFLAVNSGSYDSIGSVKLSYTDADGNADTFTQYLNNSTGVVSFDGMDVYVEKDDSAEVTLSVVTNSINAGADAGDLIQFKFLGDGSTSDFRAVGEGSGTVVEEDASTIVDVTPSTGTATFGVYHAIPTITNVSSTYITSSGMPTGTAAKVYYFSVNASGGPVALNKVSFTYSSSGLSTAIDTAANWNLYKYGDDSAALATSGVTVSSGVVAVTIQTNGGQEVISSGSTNVYYLVANVTPDAAAQTNSLSITMTQESARDADGDYVDAGAASDDAVGAVADLHASNKFIWSDYSADYDNDSSTSHSTTSNDWTNGYKLGIPTSSQSY